MRAAKAAAIGPTVAVWVRRRAEEGGAAPRLQGLMQRLGDVLSVEESAAVTIQALGIEGTCDLQGSATMPCVPNLLAETLRSRPRGHGPSCSESVQSLQCKCSVSAV